MYSRKWTKMHWWYSMKYFREYDILSHSKLTEILSQIPPTIESRQILSPQKDPSYISTMVLMQKLLLKYPELRYIPGPKLSTTPEQLPNSSHILLDFVTMQKNLINKGFKEEKAFEMVEKQYQDRLQRKKNDFLLTQGAALNNQARSLYNVYQQQSEYESRLKVLRLERDLQKYESARKSFEQKILESSKQKENDSSYIKDSLEEALIKDDDQELLKELSLEKGLIKEKPYKKVLEKIVYKGFDVGSEEGKPGAKEVIEEFLQGSKNVFAMYLDLTSMKDRLSGLNDREISESLNDSPRKFKSRSKLLRKKLEKYNVKLNKIGELDFSESSAPLNIRKKLEKDPLMARMALFSKELDFEFEHMEKKKETAELLKYRLENLEKEAMKRQEEERLKEMGFIERDFKSYEPLDEKTRITDRTKTMPLFNFPDFAFFKKEASYR